MTEAEREILLSQSEVLRYAKGDYLWQTRGAVGRLHLIAEGAVGLESPLPSGQTGLVNILGAGMPCGEIPLLLGWPEYFTSAVALRATTTYVLQPASFQLLETNPRVQRLFQRQLAGRILELQQMLAEQMYCSLEERLLSRLSRLSEIFGGELPLTQTQLAQFVGSSRQSVNHALRRLVEEGVVDVARTHIRVRDVQKLRLILAQLRGEDYQLPALYGS
ncbi:MAG: Crp/Fnr family transcriptional regulator [Leucobacter sp.]